MKRYIVLKDIADINMGQSPKSEYYTSDSNYMPFIQGNRTFGYKYPFYDIYCTKPTKIASKNSVLMSVRAPVGDLNIAPTDLCIGRGIAEIKSKTDENEYLYYVLLANKNKLDRSGNGSIFNSIGKDELSNFKLKVPKFENKRIFIESLSNIDNKINLNSMLSASLEEYAQLIFHKWFVDLNFPDEEGKPYRDNGGVMHEVDGKMIPAGWDRIELNSIVKIKTETLNPQENPDKLFNHYSIPVFDEKKLPQMELGKSILSNKYMVDSNNILVSKLNPWFKRVAYPYNVEEAVCSTEFVVWEPAINNILESLYIIANTDSFTLHCTKAANGTSNSHKRVNPNYMLKYKINYNESILYEFNKIAKPIVMRINQAIFENQQLTEIRDLLIKKLIV